MDASLARRRGSLRYQSPQSTQTLAEGLAEYYAANEGIVTRPSDLPPASAQLFRSHDLCHVIFGLSTNLSDEAMADARTMLSCDVGFARYADYLRTDSQAKALFAQFGVLQSIWITVRALPRIFRAVLEMRRVRKRWPWTPPDDYLGRSLADLRREHGIRLI
jgi:hypothetical protein